MKGATALMSSARGGGVGSDHWCTPPEVLDRVRAVGAIALDPCSNERSVVAAPHTFDGSTPECDGLRAPWGAYVTLGSLVFANPPYSAIRAWAVKIASEARAGVPIIALVPARTDTKAWRAMSSEAIAIAFWNGRIHFLVEEAPSGPAPFPSALLGFNISVRRFRAAFVDHASVYHGDLSG